MSVISNTTVLSNFAAIGELDVLCQVYETLYLSTHVYEEIAAGLASAYRFYGAIEDMIDPPHAGSWLRLTGMASEPELRTFRECPPGLHAGEASCIAIARHRDWTVLTDDREARAEARRLEVRVSGTIGTLVRAVESGTCGLAAANTWLGQMIRQRYRSPVTDLAPLLNR